MSLDDVLHDLDRRQQQRPGPLSRLGGADDDLRLGRAPGP
jgi:hypothetical protein